MSLAAILSAYLGLNLLVVIGYLGLSWFRDRDTAIAELRTNYRVLSALMVISGLAPLMGFEPRFGSPAMIRAETAEPGSFVPFSEKSAREVLAIHSPKGSSELALAPLRNAALVLAILLFGAICFQFRSELRKLAWIRARSRIVRRVGRVTVRATTDSTVPFAYWTPGRAEVFIPERVLDDGHALRMVLAHELQHHRQRDTIWAYPIWMLRMFCAWNPFARWWARRLAENQEFAVDEILVDRRKIEPRRYARCLLEMAESALATKPVLARATGMAFRRDRQLLKRRVERMIKLQGMKKKTNAWSAGILIALMAGAAYASQGLIQDRRVTLSDATEWAKSSNGSSDFPADVNDLVVRELNYFLGTSEARDATRKVLERMEVYRPMIVAKIRAADAPVELLAVPFVESGFENKEVRTPNFTASGLWMFIASTARKFGLEVDDTIDERRNPELSTDAAIRYLKQERVRYGDWRLALLSYNIGGTALERGILAHDTRDAWKLIRSGLKTDRAYLPRIMAAVLILRNPELAQ